MKSLGIILAAGKGTRMNSKDRNKTSLELKGKPLVQYGVELFEKNANEIYVVVGAYADTVKDAISSGKVSYVEQLEQKGTGHAVQVALDYISEKGIDSDIVLIGYGDHMAKYSDDLVKQMITDHVENKNSVTLIAAVHDNPESLAWGRVVRDSEGRVVRVVEQKNATEEEFKITELNAGFYIVNFDVAKDLIQKIKPNEVNQELYLTDIVDLANESGLRVGAFSVPFESVGYGVNTKEHLESLEKSI